MAYAKRLPGHTVSLLLGIVGGLFIWNVLAVSISPKKLKESPTQDSLIEVVEASGRISVEDVAIGSRLVRQGQMIPKPAVFRTSDNASRVVIRLDDVQTTLEEEGRLVVGLGTRKLQLDEGRLMVSSDVVVEVLLPRYGLTLSGRRFLLSVKKGFPRVAVLDKMLQVLDEQGKERILLGSSVYELGGQWIVWPIIGSRTNLTTQVRARNKRAAAKGGLSMKSFFQEKKHKNSKRLPNQKAIGKELVQSSQYNMNLNFIRYLQNPMARHREAGLLSP